MKTDWKLGDKFCYYTNKDSKERGYLVGKAELGGKYVVEYVLSDCVVGDGLIFYFDEIKPVITTKGELV